MTDERTGYATENVVEPTPEELEALRPLVGTLASAMVAVYRPDGDAVTETSAGDVGE